MKTEMKIMPNGNYEEVISPIQHECSSGILKCLEYGWDRGNLLLKIEDGDPYEDGFSYTLEINYCPICGYRPERLNPEDHFREAT